VQSIQQQRAKYALQQVTEAIERQGEEKINQKEYKSYASSLPAMIHMNGLGQAAAFFRSKGTDSTHFILYQLLSNWLTQEGQPYDDYQDLLEAITESDMALYRLAQIEAQALMSWVKKFAKTFMGEE